MEAITATLNPKVSNLDMAGTKQTQTQIDIHIGKYLLLIIMVIIMKETFDLSRYWSILF